MQHPGIHSMLPTIERRESAANTRDEETVEYYREAFKLFDVDKNGSIDVNELGAVMRSCGIDPTEEEIRNMIATIDADGTLTIDFQEFLQMMEEFRRDAKLFGTREKLEEAFRAMDSDGNGFITTGDLVAVLRLHGEELSAEEAAELIREADSDGDGQVGFADFAKLVREWSEK